MDVGVRTQRQQRLGGDGGVRRMGPADSRVPPTPVAAPATGPAPDAGDALAATLARAVEARSSVVEPPSDVALLQRKYWVYDATSDKWSEATDVAAELKELDDEVNSNVALNDVRALWKATAMGDLKRALGRMVDETDRDTVKGYFLEAIGFNAPTKDWAFQSRENAVRAVLAESRRSAAEATETSLAKQVLGGGATAKAIQRDVRSYGKKALALIQSLIDSTALDDTFGAKTQRYGFYYNPFTIFGKYTVGPRKALHSAVSATDCDVVKAIAAITDICSALYKIDPAFVSVKPDQQKATSPSGTEAIDDIRDDDTGTMLETSESMKYARSHGMLVDVGPSYTTGRLLTLGVQAGANDREQTAVALALFAFWNVHYWRAASGIHHFHFVMDMLQNFVPGKYKYGGYPKHISEIYDFDNVAEGKEQDALVGS